MAKDNSDNQSEPGIIQADFISSNEWWQITPHLRWKRKEVEGGMEGEIGVITKVLQQMWQGSNGNQEWRDVEIVRD